MIVTEIKGIDEIEKVVKYYFSKDDELFSKWHVKAGEGEDECMKDTRSVLENDTYQLRFFEIRLNKEPFGFFATETYQTLNFLTTFFVMPKYRTSEYMEGYWQLIRERFSYKPFESAIYEKNTPAVNHLKRNGGRVVSRMKHKNNVVLNFKFI